MRNAQIIDRRIYIVTHIQKVLNCNCMTLISCDSDFHAYATAGVLTWGELSDKLEILECEKAALMRDAATGAATMMTKLEQCQQSETRLRDELKRIELERLRTQYASLSTSMFTIRT